MVAGAATDPHPQGLRDGVPEEYDRAYLQLADAFPLQYGQLHLLYGAGQRAFEEKTRESVRITVTRILANALSDPRLADRAPNAHLAEYLDQEIAEVRARLNQDGAMAVSRGLNVGLGVGIAVSVVLFAVPLLWGLDALGGLGVSLNCSNRWSLLAAVVCGGVGALGAVLSVLIRVRNGSNPMARRENGGTPAARRDNGSVTGIAPAQMARAMRHEGAYRVLVGWILALAVYFLIGGGVIDLIKVPATMADICPVEGPGPEAALMGTRFWVFWCAVGFLAGFNERWAFGLLHRKATRSSKP
ncbi:hypothetical protein P8605_40235 [Streptomyces sp. T-3]|nr:hypothetical protein [Streptomyces sp. T-3]